MILLQPVLRVERCAERSRNDEKHISGNRIFALVHLGFVFRFNSSGTKLKHGAMKSKR